MRAFKTSSEGRRDYLRLHTDLSQNKTQRSGFTCVTRNKAAPFRLSYTLDTNEHQATLSVEFTCALLSDGTVQRWRTNVYGGLGDGTATSSTVPVRVMGITNAIAIAAGGLHACALLADGTVQCWRGWHDNRQQHARDRADPLSAQDLSLRGC